MSIKKKNKKSELDKLEQYLKKKKIKYERVDKDYEFYPDSPYLCEFNKHQIKVLNDEGGVIWDVICHYGSYGYEQGLLEAMGESLIGHDDVEGWLTAKEVIDMYERRSYEKSLDCVV